MKKVSRILMAVLTSFAVALAVLPLASCGDGSSPENGESSAKPQSDNGGQTVTNEQKPTPATDSKIETYTGSFVIAQDAYKTLNIVDDGTYEMTDALESGVEDDWGTWTLVSDNASRATATAKTIKKYNFKSKVHKTDSGKEGTFIIETNPAGAAVIEDEESETKLEVSGAGLDKAETIYKTSTPVKIEGDTLNLTEKEQNEVFTLEAIEKGGEKAGVKITFKEPASMAGKTLTQVQITSGALKGEYGLWNKKEKVIPEIYFPFVDEDSYITISAMVEYESDRPAPDHFSALYILNTKSGKGGIGNLPKNYTNWDPCLENRIVFKDGTATVNDIAGSTLIPSGVKLTSSSATFALSYTNLEDRWTDGFWGDYVSKDITEFTDTYNITGYPLPNKKASKGYKYYFYQFRYDFTVEGDVLNYVTPEIVTPLYEVPEAKNSLHGNKYYGTDRDFGGSCTWSFDAETVTQTAHRYSDGNNAAPSATRTTVYSYTVDEAKSVLTLNFKSLNYSSDELKASISNAEEYFSLGDNKDESADALEYTTDEFKALYLTPKKYYYEIYDNNRIEMNGYFDGELPTIEEFDNEDDAPISVQDGFLWIESSDNDEEDYRCTPTFSDGKFSGSLFKTTDHGQKYTKLGVIEGTYKTSKESGSKEADSYYSKTGGNWSVTFTFTKIPEGTPVIKLNTPYKQTRGH